MQRKFDSRQKAELSGSLNASVRDRFKYAADAGVIVTVVDSGDVEHPPAAAWYDPREHDAYVHLNEAQIKRLPCNDNDTATLLGLTAHESAHARWSGWMFEVMQLVSSKVEFSILELFEEIRIEYRAARDSSTARSHLRRSLRLILDPDRPLENRFDGAYTWGLGYGRVIAGVVDPPEVDWLDSAARVVLGDDDVGMLTDILTEAVVLTGLDDPSKIESGATARIIQLAREWIEIVGAPTEVPTLCVALAGAIFGHSEPLDSKDEGTAPAPAPAVPGEDDEESDMLGMGEFDSTESNGVDPAKPLTADQAAIIRDSAVVVADKVATDWTRTISKPPISAAEAAKKVFFNDKKKSVGYAATPPKPADRREIVIVARAMERLAIPAIHKTRTASVMPPGRLRTRDAVRRSADHSMGLISNARPWEGVARRHGNVKPVVFGLATDKSGSMGWAGEAVARVAFVWTNAGRRIGARTAAVTFGSSVVAIASPGEQLDEVRLQSATDGREECDYAIAALDGALRFSEMNGYAKLLMIVSDGHLVITGETARVTRRLQTLVDAGTSVIWVTPRTNPMTDNVKKMGGVVATVSNTDRAFESIETAAIQALQKLLSS